MANVDHDPKPAPTPHDGLVKRVFTDPETAAVELRQVLPAKLCARLDWKTLEVVPSSFIDPELQPRQNDILYSIALRGSGAKISIYTVFEHQSTPDATMAARFVVYVGRFYERYLSQHDKTKTVPLVIPVLLYQGPTGWTLPRRLSEMLDVPPDLLEVFPSPIELSFAVDDLEDSLLGERVTRDQLTRDRGLARAEMARTMLWLYHHPEATTGERAATLGLLLDFIAATWGPEGIKPFLTYFVSRFDRISPLRGILLESVSKENHRLYVTIAEEWIAEGKIEGKAEAFAEMLEKLLDTRGLTLSDALRERVAHCKDEALLQRWFDRAITATTLTTVFDD